MGLFFYNKFSLQTKYTTDRIKQVFYEKINNPRNCKGIEKAIADGWLISVDFNTDRFQIALKQKRWFLLQRENIGTILKGKIIENKTIGKFAVSMLVRLSDEYVYLLGFIFSALIGALVYGLANHITDLSIISSILIFMCYTMSLITFNLQVKIYKRIINSFFTHPKYNVAI